MLPAALTFILHFKDTVAHQKQEIIFVSILKLLPLVTFLNFNRKYQTLTGITLIRVRYGKKASKQRGNPIDNGQSYAQGLILLPIFEVENGWEMCQRLVVEFFTVIQHLYFQKLPSFLIAYLDFY